MTANPLLDEALANAARGWRVFPAAEPRADGDGCSCARGTDCADPGKHPRIKGWRDDATTDEQKTRRWWARWPRAGVAIATGAASGLVVLDVDPDKGGADSLRALVAEHGPLPETPISLTGGGGEHYLFSYPESLDVRNSTGKVGAGLDVRGVGGFIISPGSRHISGGQYVWEASAHPDDTPVAPLPGWLLDAMTATSSGNGAQPRVDTAAVLAGVAEGQRDDALFRFASKLRHADVPRDAAVELVLTAAGNCDPPFPAEDALAKVENAYTRYTPGANGSQPDDKPIAFHRTDSGNAELFSHLYGNRLRYDHRRRRWLVWAEHHWQPDADAEVRRLAKAAARWRFHAAADIDDLKEREAQAKWAIGSESRKRLDAVLSLAQAEKPLADAGDDWDTDPWLLGVPNGVVDLHTGVLRPGRQDDRITMQAGVAFDPSAECPRFERFLEEIFDGDQEVIDFTKRSIGYSFSGDTSEEMVIIGHGFGANGKSTLFKVLRNLLGSYAFNMPFSTIEAGHKGSVPNDLAALANRRLVTSSETNEGTRLNESRLKALTGRDPITARFLFSEFFEFVPVAKFWLAVNHKPHIEDDSYGFWRRVRLLPFLRRFRGDEDDKHLDDKLNAELAGILALGVRGCLAWQREGLEPPERVRTATEEYQRESDPLAAFIDDRCVTMPHCEIKGGHLYKAYRRWAEDEGLSQRETLSATKFGRMMGERFRRERSRGGNIYHGIGLEG